MSVSIFDDDVDDSDEYVPDPPAPPDYDLETIIDMLDRVRRANSAAQALSMALCSIEARCFGKSSRPLVAEARVRVLIALEQAYRAAWRRLPPEYPREKIVSGMRAAAALVDRWCTRRPLVSCDVAYDARDLARCFRNDLHNMSLAEEMKDRAERRELFAPSGQADLIPAIAFLDADCPDGGCAFPPKRSALLSHKSHT